MNNCEQREIVKSQIINKLNLNSGNFKVKTWMRDAKRRAHSNNKN